MKEHIIMIRKIAIYSAVVLAVAIVLGIVFRGRITTWLQRRRQSRPALPPSQQTLLRNVRSSITTTP